MAVINIKYFSELVHQNVEYNVIIPEKADVKTNRVIYLLHGLYGNAYAWIKSGNAIDIADKYNVIFVMPEAFNSFYINHRNDYKYFDYIAYEVIEHSKKIFTLAGDWYIAGLSMGGYGALHVGLKHDIFKGIGSFSGALDPKIAILDSNISFLMELCDDFKDNNCIINLLESKTRKYPIIYTYCGRNDMLYQMNKDYSKIFPQYCDKYFFEEDEGIHSWEMWTLCLEKFLKII